MLKIKDNVDLKELEKFGFKYETENYDEEGKWEYYDKNNFIITQLDEDYPEKERIINNEYSRCDYCFDDENIDTLYDLIKADLVEKVDDE